MVAHTPRSFPRRRESSPEPVKTAVPASAETSGAKTVVAEIERWLTHLGAERRYSPKTVEAYRRDITQFLDFLTDHLGGRPSLKDLTALTPPMDAPFWPSAAATPSAAVRSCARWPVCAASRVTSSAIIKAASLRSLPCARRSLARR